MGQTALNLNAGGRTRWSAILGGVCMLAFVLLIPGLVGRTLRETLPSPQGSSRPVVVLRLRGRTRVGSTLASTAEAVAQANAWLGTAAPS